MQARQGDLLLERVDELPEDVEDRGSRVVIEGEATGHAHRLDQGTTLEDEEETLFIDVPDGAELSHEEHATIELKPGTYQVHRQREFDGFDSPRRNSRSSTRYVMD